MFFARLVGGFIYFIGKQGILDQFSVVGISFYQKRHTQPLLPYSVAISFPCRNNFDKNQANFLESAQNPRTFASVI